MDIQANQIKDVTVLTLAGNVDNHTSPNIIKVIKDQIAGGKNKLVLDLGSVEYLSSAGLRMLLVGIKETRSRDGDICLASVQSDVRRVLDLSGFANMLKVFDNVESALTSYS